MYRYAVASVVSVIVAVGIYFGLQSITPTLLFAPEDQPLISAVFLPVNVINLFTYPHHETDRIFRVKSLLSRPDLNAYGASMIAPETVRISQSKDIRIHVAVERIHITVSPERVPKRNMRYTMSLHAPNDAFTLIPSPTQEHDLSAGDAEWLWSVSPKSLGDYTLILEGLSVQEQSGSNLTVPSPGEAAHSLPQTDRYRLRPDGAVEIRITILDPLGLSARTIYWLNAAKIIIPILIGALALPFVAKFFSREKLRAIGFGAER